MPTWLPQRRGRWGFVNPPPSISALWGPPRAAAPVADGSAQWAAGADRRAAPKALEDNTPPPRQVLTRQGWPRAQGISPGCQAHPAGGRGGRLEERGVPPCVGWGGARTAKLRAPHGGPSRRTRCGRGRPHLWPVRLRAPSAGRGGRLTGAGVPSLRSRSHGAAWCQCVTGQLPMPWGRYPSMRVHLWRVQYSKMGATRIMWVNPTEIRQDSHWGVPWRSRAALAPAARSVGLTACPTAAAGQPSPLRPASPACDKRPAWGGHSAVTSRRVGGGRLLAGRQHASGAAQRARVWRAYGRAGTGGPGWGPPVAALTLRWL